MSQKKDSFFLSKVAKKREFRPNLSQLKEKKKEDSPLTKSTASGEGEVKKPFDKKSYRLKKYSNKYQLDKWENQRKKKVLRNYYKEIRNDGSIGTYKPINFDEDSESEKDLKTIPIKKTTEKTETTSGRFVRHPDFIVQLKDQGDKKEPSQSNVTKAMQDIKLNFQKKDAFWKAKQEFIRIKLSKEEKKRMIEQSKKEKDEKLLQYKKKKVERFKKLSQKTRKGQPVMTGRLELLLEKIEQTHK